MKIITDKNKSREEQIAESGKMCAVCFVTGVVLLIAVIVAEHLL